MQMKSFIDEFGLSRADVENWISRPSVQLRTKYASTAKGRAREFTRKNVMELVLVGKLIEVGVRPSEAAMWAETAIEDYCSGISSIEWMAFPARQLGQMITAKKFIDLALSDMFSQHDGAVAIINAGQFLREVDKLFGINSEGA